MLKFFLPDARSDSGDRALAAAMRKTKVLLQAGGQRGPGLRKLPERFRLMRAPADSPAVHASDGSPLPLFADAAADVGYVDVSSTDRVPIVEVSDGFYVKSLETECVELALAVKARIEPGVAVALGAHRLATNAASEVAVHYPPRDALDYVPFTDFVSGPTPNVKDKIVIIGVDLPRLPTFRTPIGVIGPHRVFWYSLVSLYAAVASP